jgi:hypothetical protein
VIKHTGSRARSNDRHGRKYRILTITAILIIVIGLAVYLVRPPGPGRVYQYRSDVYGVSENTALLLRNGGCLVLSRSDEDIGQKDTVARTESRLFMIAGAERIRSRSDARGAYLVDDASGLVARPGDAIDGEIIFKSNPTSSRDTLAAGWPIDHGCGRGLAILLSISRVHR